MARFDIVGSIDIYIDIQNKAASKTLHYVTLHIDIRHASLSKSVERTNIHISRLDQWMQRLKPVS